MKNTEVTKECLLAHGGTRNEKGWLPKEFAL